MSRSGTLWLAAIAALCAATVSMANSGAALTAKQARLQGLPTIAKPVEEQQVGRLIVKFRESGVGASSQSARAGRMGELAAASRVGMSHVREMAGGASLVALAVPMPLADAKAVAARIAADPAVEYAEPDIMMKRQATPTETRFNDWQWNLFAPTTPYVGDAPKANVLAAGGANLPRAWDVTTGSSLVVVAVIDTGIVNHTDLNGSASNLMPYVPAGRFLPGYDFISENVGAGTLPSNFVANDGDGRDSDPSDPGDWVTTDQEALYPTVCDDSQPGPQDSSWHGTHMAGVVGATTNNGLGIAGVAWNVRVQPIRALGRCGGALSDISEAIRWAAGLPVGGVPNNSTPARVISLSLGGGTTCSASMQSAVDAAIAAGSVVIAATGNDGSTGVISPANCNGVIGVTAHTINGENADYANIGSGTAISAPGGGKPSVLGAGGVTDDAAWTGYYLWSTLLFGSTTPTSTDSMNRTGPAYGGFTGTSAATPQVAGVAALIKSILPSATPQQVRTFLLTNARAFPAGSACAAGGTFVGQCGAGMLDATAALNAAALVALPTLTAAPQNASIVEGQTATFSVSAVGATPMSYQWRRNGVDIAGANAASYTTAALSAGDSGTRYAVTVTNSVGSVTSAEATVTVTASPAVTGGPASPPTGGGGGGGALPLAHFLWLAALMFAARRQRRR